MSEKERLRAAVLDEIALVEGRIAVAEKLTGDAAKEQLRLAHRAQRQVRLREAAEFLAAREDLLVREFADGREVDPAAIDPVIIPVRTPAEADLFKFATLQWSVPVSSGYGRRTRFLVRDRQNGKLIAIFALGDPVIAQSARDAAIGWTKPQRNARLYNVYDAFILGAVEPYRQLLAGKLVALLTLANETRDVLIRKYAGNTTEIRKAAKDPTPVLITTSSALGRSSVYNRITYRGTLMFHSVGYTKGFGHFQFSDELFADLLAYVRQRTDEAGGPTKAHSSRYGSGPNWRFRVLRRAFELLEVPESALQHNIKREVFLAPLADNWEAYLRGEAATPEPFDLPADKIAQYYRERWAIPRAERRPGFRYWRRDDVRLTPFIGGPAQLTFGSRALPGQVEMGDYRLSVGIGKRHVDRAAPSGAPGPGTAYLSRIEGPGVDVTIADTSWPSGDREVSGINASGGFADVVDRLRIGVHPAPRFRDMVMMELRQAVRTGSGRPSARRVSALTLSELAGFDIAESLDRLFEASVGTREQLLRDAGPRRHQLCVVFRSGDAIVPALAWCLVRVVPLLDPAVSGRVLRPDLRRAAPRPNDIDGDAGESRP